MESVRKPLGAATLEQVREQFAELTLKMANVAVLLASFRDNVADASDSDKALTPKEAAKVLNVKVTFLYHNWKKIPGAKKLGHRTLRFSSRGLERYQRMRTAA